jgi:hypothetical protein
VLCIGHCLTLVAAEAVALRIQSMHRLAVIPDWAAWL